MEVREEVKASPSFLEEKGLVASVIRGKKRFFEAADPRRMLDVLKEREKAFKDILPALKARHELSKEKQDVTVFTGVKGIRTVLDKILEELRPNGTYYDFGAGGLFRLIMGPYWDIWQRKKKEYGIKSYVIFNERLKKTNPQLLRDYVGAARFQPAAAESITDTFIYKDTVVLCIWTAKPPVAIVIKNKENAKSYENQFKLMWKLAKKLERRMWYYSWKHQLVG